MSNFAALKIQRTELKACIAASESQLSILSAQQDMAFGAIAAEVAALIRNQRKLSEIEEQLTRSTLGQPLSLAA